MSQSLLLVGAGLKATGQIMEGRAAEKQGKFTKQIAIRNQRALERQAVAEREAAAVEASRIARQEKIVSGRQIAAAGKTGGQVAGASLNFLADTARQFSLSRNFALRAGLFRSQELKERGQIIAAQGRFARSVGLFQKRLSFIKAGSTLLMAGGSGGTPKNVGAGSPTWAGGNTVPGFGSTPTSTGTFYT